jgi:hypothetical protein
VALLRASPTVALYFGAANGAATALQTYNARGTGFFSTGGAKLQRERRVKKSSSTGRCILERAAPAQTTFTHLYTFNKIKQASIIHK